MPYPDEELPQMQFSLQDFVILGSELIGEDHHDPFAFARLVLAGRADDVDGEKRILINARMNAVPPPVRPLRRDIDSAIGVTSDLPFNKPLAVYPIAPFGDTLTKDNHLRRVIHLPEQIAQIVPLHHIPNMGLGKVQNRHITRVFFPRLYKKNGVIDVRVDQPTMRRIYNNCLRPAIIYAVDEDQCHWPPSYEAAMKLAKDQRGKLHLGTVDVHPNRLLSFSDEFLRQLSEYPDLRDAFFVHELRGTKSACLHPFDHDQEVDAALDGQLEFLDSTRVRTQDWHVDVGLEIRKEGHVVQWLTLSHAQILHYLLPHLNDDQIHQIETSKKFQLDRAAQLKDFAGFRVVPLKRLSAEDSPVYIQAYTTDKTATYQLHNGIFRRRKPSELLPDGIGRLTEDIVKMEEIFQSCTRENQEGTARLEVRVPLSQARHVLRALPRRFVEDTTVCIPCETWWYFKLHRLMSISYVIKSLRNSQPRARICQESLALGALLVYMLNALSRRQEEDEEWTSLLEKSCWHVLEEDDDDDEGHPILYDQGLYFLSDLIDDAAFRLPATRLPSDFEIAKLYDASTYTALQCEFGSVTGQPIQTAASTTRVPNRTMKRTLDLRNTHRDLPVIPVLREAAEGVRVKPGVRLTGPDFFLPRRCRHGSDVGDILTEIWVQFPFDVFQLSPNHKKGSLGSYTLLQNEDRKHVTIDVFKSLDLSTVFSEVQYRVVPAEFWETTLFDRYFPEKGQGRPIRFQNFQKAQYFNQWAMLMDELTNSDAARVRKAILTLFNELKWLPHAQSDRMWATKVMKGNGWNMKPQGPQRTAVQVAINPAHWNSEELGIGILQVPDEGEGWGEGDEVGGEDNEHGFEN